MKAVAKAPCMTAPEIDPRLHTCLLDTLYGIVRLAFFLLLLHLLLIDRRIFRHYWRIVTNTDEKLMLHAVFFLRVFMRRLTGGLHTSRDSL